MANLKAKVTWLGAAFGRSFECEPLPELSLAYEGIPGDKHAGLLRESGVREPWYPRGTEMRNERQLSVLGAEELRSVAEALELAELSPGWIGANIVLEGVAELTQLPPRTLLLFEGGATVRIDGDNAPCRSAGRGIVRHVPERPDVEFGFVKQAMGKRGLVGWVEKPGTVRLGEAVTVRVW